MEETQLKRTSLFDTHTALGARMVEFGGWEMPVLYSGIAQEHHAVRQAAGLFDISHMGEFLFDGPDALKFLNQLLTNDLAKLEPGQGQYTLLCQDNGGVIDDLYAYRLGDTRHLLIVNASRLEIDWMWIKAQRNSRHKSLQLEVSDRSGELSAMALQGPKAAEIIAGVFPAATELRKNQIAELEFGGATAWVSRTGYTGEDGFELVVPNGRAAALWEQLMSLGQALGAVALSAMAGYAFARFTFSGKRLLFVLAVALILVPRQLFAVPLFSWVNELGLSDSLLGVMLPGVVAGLGVVYSTQVFRQVPEEYLQAARICGATELRVFLTVLPLVWPALLSYGMIHFILAWHEHLIPMLVLTSETKQTLPLALAKLYDVSQRTPQGVQMAASTFAVIPTAVLFALCHRKFKSSLSDMLVH